MMQAVKKADWKPVQDPKCHKKGCCKILARRLRLVCGHTVYRIPAWNGARDPRDLPHPKRVRCEQCQDESL
jgi:hypothetical protein